jgi:hypothetical protein
MAVSFALLVVLGVIVLAVGFFINARRIRRDVTRRFDELEERLERQATSIVNNLFDATNR